MTTFNLLFAINILEFAIIMLAVIHAPVPLASKTSMRMELSVGITTNVLEKMAEIIVATVLPV